MTTTQHDPTLDDRIITFEPQVQHSLTRYVRQWFAPEDDALITVRRNTPVQGLPEIQIRPEEGRMLQFLAASVGARRLLEIGTLAGYSGIWLARALPEGGLLTTLELDPHHAEVARAHFRLAGVTERVELIEGDAQNTLARLASREPFDMVFIDADKEGYPYYLAWSLAHVRPGGLITAHNAFRGGDLVGAEPSDGTLGLRRFLETMARHARLVGTIIPVGDGIAAAVVM
jgi:caffeoyl-CoA O-methyltransferase